MGNRMNKLKVMTIVGTRPEIIRLSRIVARLDEDCDHVLVHTGQNFDHELSETFFQEMGIRRPDHFMNAAGGSADPVHFTATGVESWTVPAD